MMYKVTISDAAEADLDEIVGYIASALADPQAAASLTGRSEMLFGGGPSRWRRKNTCTQETNAL